MWVKEFPKSYKNHKISIEYGKYLLKQIIKFKEYFIHNEIDDSPYYKKMILMEKVIKFIKFNSTYVSEKFARDLDNIISHVESCKRDAKIDKILE